jgi:hypothetical protein
VQIKGLGVVAEEEIFLSIEIPHHILIHASPGSTMTLVVLNFESGCELYVCVKLLGYTSERRSPKPASPCGP